MTTQMTAVDRRCDQLDRSRRLLYIEPQPLSSNAVTDKVTDPAALFAQLKALVERRRPCLR